MSEKEKDASKDNVPSTEDDSSPEELRSSPDSDKKDSSEGSEHAPFAGESFADSPKPFSPFVSGDSSPVEGAVGGEVENSAMHKQENHANNVNELNRQATALDRRGLHSGKLDVFRRFFNENELDFCTLPENRRRHRAERQRHYSEGGRPGSDQRSSDENPLGHLQVLDPEPEAVLNQAGAIVGITSRPSEFQNLRGYREPTLPGFGRVGDPDHSIGSAETAPIGDVYAGNFSPVNRPPSEISNRGMSSGSSFPSFSSRPPTASDFYNPSISPLPDSVSTDGARRMSPMSTDSDSLPSERPVRRRRFGVSQPISVPTRSKSMFAGSLESYPDESQRRVSASAAVPERKISKDSSVDYSERISSEDEAGNYPELSRSIESDHSLPMPDVNQDGAESLRQNLDALQVSVGTASGISASEGGVQNPEQETEESESEQDPVSVLSCSPDASKSSEQPPSNKDEE